MRGRAESDVLVVHQRTLRTPSPITAQTNYRNSLPNLFSLHVCEVLTTDNSDWAGWNNCHISFLENRRTITLLRSSKVTVLPSAPFFFGSSKTSVILPQTVCATRFSYRSHTCAHMSDFLFIYFCIFHKRQSSRRSISYDTSYFALHGAVKKSSFTAYTFQPPDFLMIKCLLTSYANLE